MTATEMIAGLREYADYLEAHPEIEVTSGCISNYGVHNPAKVLGLLHSHTASSLVTTTSEIDYIRQSFGALNVEYVIKKSVCRVPTIKDNEIVWVVKPEFEGAAVAQ